MRVDTLGQLSSAFLKRPGDFVHGSSWPLDEHLDAVPAAQAGQRRGCGPQSLAGAESPVGGARQ